MARRALFFYGSLRDETLLSCVLGRAPEAVSLEAAVLPGHEVRAVAGEGFPCIVAREGAEAPGALLRDATEAEAARVAFFEDEAEFELAPMTVRAAGGEAQEALVCRPLARIAPRGPWRLEDWAPEARAMLIEAAQEVMALYEAGVDWSDPALWPGIQARAAARARGKGEARRPGLPGAPGAGTG
ncbi:MAG: gamma-glutamylcyclotransferase family protein, partial [Pseudomonadota bacterium]